MKVWAGVIVAAIVLLTVWQYQGEQGLPPEDLEVVAEHEERLRKVERDTDLLIQDLKTLEGHIEESDGVQIDFMAEPIRDAE